MKLSFSSIFTLLAAMAVLHAAPEVRIDRTNPADPDWSFARWGRPSKSDAAQGATVRVTAGTLRDQGGPLSVLVDGRLPAASDHLKEEVFFCDEGGTLVVDLGKSLPVGSVTTYSWHEWEVDQGSRAPQVYRLSGSANEQDWTPLAEVDTRPNKTGEKWNGQHAARISDSSGKLGDFRFMRFEISPTRSPKQTQLDWTNTLFSEIDVQAAGTQPDGAAVVVRPPKVTDVWVVIKTHFDLGFTDQAENVFQRYRTEMMDKALAVIDQNRALPEEKRFVWTVPGWPLKAQMLGPKQDPVRKARIEEAVREGSIAVHALSSTTHTESLDPEDLVRSLGFSSSIARQYGRPLPIAAKMTDVPSHSWIIPTLLHHAGVEFLHLGCNAASQYPRVPPLFWWEGGDGSRILCAYSTEYGSDLTPPSDWPSRHYLAMIMTGDNHGPPTPEQVEKWRQQMDSALPGVKVHFGTLDDFARAVLTEQPKLETVRGDMPDTWIHGLMSNPASTQLARRNHILAMDVETLDTHMRAWGLNPPSLGDTLPKAYEQDLLYGEHTWGMNAEYGPRTLHGEAWKKWMAEMEAEPKPADGDYTKLPRGSKRKWMQSYQDHRDYAEKADSILWARLADLVTLLANSARVKPGQVVAFNPLPWKASITMPPSPDGKSAIHIPDIPPGGYKVVEAPKDEPVRTEPSEPVLETDHFRARFDLEKGGITSLVEKATGRDLVDATAPYALGQYLHERFSTHEVFDRFFRKYSRIQDGWGLNDIGKPNMADAEKAPYRATAPGPWKLVFQQDAALQQAILTCRDTKGLAEGYTLTFSFPRHENWVEVKWEVRNKTADKHPEGGWLCFPFAVADPHFTVGRPGAPIDPARDIVPGTNRHLMAVASGVAINAPDGSGAALCPIDSPLVSLDKPGLWWWTMDFVPKTPSVFVNLHNNMWNTNFPLWQDGSWISRVRVWPLAKGTTATADLAVRGWEARRAPITMLCTDPPTGEGTSPPEQTGLSVSRPGVLVTAFGPNPDGEGTILRVWDQTGQSAELSVELPTGELWKTALPVDLRGVADPAAKAVPISRGRLVFHLDAFAPASFVLH